VATKIGTRDVPSAVSVTGTSTPWLGRLEQAQQATATAIICMAKYPLCILTVKTFGAGADSRAWSCSSLDCSHLAEAVGRSPTCIISIDDHLCTSLDGAALGAGAASEIANVSQVFQPSGRFLASNSKYDFSPRKPCFPAIGKMYPN
jgi:hypothetical protein